MADEPASNKRPRQDDDSEADHRAIKRSLIDYTHTNTITVFVGPKERQFIVHKDPICAKSKFFKAACSSRWKEGQEKAIRLPEVEEEVEEEALQSYVHWAYSDTLVSESTAGRPISMMIKLYLLGDKLDDINLRNKTLMALHSHAVLDRLQPGPKSIEAIWHGTPPSSPVRRWIIDIMIARLSTEAFERNMAKYPPEFVQELALNALKQKSSTDGKEVRVKLPLYIELDEDA